MKKLTLILFFLFSVFQLYSWEYDGRHGWPLQRAPKRLILTDLGKGIQNAMLVESLSGLAAQAVNEGYFDEMIWVNVKTPSYKNIFDRSVEELEIKDKDIRSMQTWDLVKYLKRKGVVKGYILYRADMHKPKGDPYSSYENANYSVNVATVYASLLKGILIDESQEAQAKKMGLKMLKDARFESVMECFHKNKNRLNNSSALSVPPIVHNLRDYAIAHKLMLYADKKEEIDPILEWVKPLSPILGWGCGDEYDFTSLISLWGHYNTATNWCSNLPFISSIPQDAVLIKSKEVELNEIDFEDKTSYHSFVMSDGDNIQWSINSYSDSHAYMGNPGCKDLGLSWTLFPVGLSVVSPFTLEYMIENKSDKASIIEYGAGYQYPDLFAKNRANRKELLREFAKRVNYHMNKMNIKIFGFICRDADSPEAFEAYKIYAEEMTGITGMIAVQYFPYELGGEIYWVENRDGIDIPVVSAKYSLWDEVNIHRPRAGTPEYIAALINRDHIASKGNKKYELSWTIVHAWSNFSYSSPTTEKPAVGYYPVKATNDMLVDDIKVISTNELLWRIRMEHRKEQTQSLLRQY